jgi:hypothetical protein
MTDDDREKALALLEEMQGADELKAISGNAPQRFRERARLFGVARAMIEQGAADERRLIALAFAAMDAGDLYVSHTSTDVGEAPNAFAIGDEVGAPCKPAIAALRSALDLWVERTDFDATSPTAPAPVSPNPHSRMCASINSGERAECDCAPVPENGT